MSTAKRPKRSDQNSTAERPPAHRRAGRRARDWDRASGIGDYVFGPSDEAKARVAEIRDRWATLQAWGVATKLPFTRTQQQSVHAFFVQWEVDPKVDQITAATADLGVMERYAEEYAQKHGEQFRAAQMKTSFDIESSTAALKAAATADKAAKEVTAVVKEAANDLLPSAGVYLPVMIVVGAGLVAVLGVLVIKTTSRPVIQYA